MRIHPQFCGFQANLTSEIWVDVMKVDLNDPYLFFSVHFFEENTFSSRLEICLQMSTKMSQNAPKVDRFVNHFLGGHAPRPPYHMLVMLA